MNNRLISFYTLIFFGWMLVGCKSKKKTVEPVNYLTLVNQKYEDIIDSVRSNNTYPQTLSIKSKVYFETPKLSDSFKMHIRMKKDSVIWISATYYNMEVARLLLTPDSVKMIDRKNGKYFLGDYDYIQNRFKVPLDFNLMQSILLGKPFSLDSAIKVRTYSSRGQLIVAALNNRWYDNGSGEKMLKQQTTQIWINPKTYRITKSKISEYRSRKQFKTTYSDTAMINGYVIPKGAVYEVKHDDDMIFTSEYLKIESPEELSFPFTISSKYEPIF